MANKNSMLVFFVAGAILLILPLILIIIWDSPNCAFTQSNLAANSFCLSPHLLKGFASFSPFVMVVGAILIGYNLKRISDSFLPPVEDSDESDSEISEP
jgi:hypothetical protein